MTTPLFPVFIKLKQSPCLVVGGGPVAERKVRALLKAGASVTLTAPEITSSLQTLFEQQKFTWNPREYLEQDIEGRQLVFAATDQGAINQNISQHCQARQILVNVADTSALCSFFMPTVVDRFPLQIAISTNGTSPMLAGILRTKLELLFPPTYAVLAKVLGGLRPWVKKQLPDSKSRFRFWQELFDSPEVQKILQGKSANIDQESLSSFVEQNISLPGRHSKRSGHVPGQVFLVGAGPGDPELLTVKALRLMQQADVVVHDHLVTDEILACVRGEAERISVGKSRGCHSYQQSEINDLLIRLAYEGKRVVRLKGGDPFVFGRGGEEVEALKKAGVQCDVVPGITAALGCAASLGIPLTHRNLAHSIVLMTGHFSKDDDQHDWPRLCQPGQTLVIYMGLSNLENLLMHFRKYGMRGDMPAALVQEGTTPHQKSVIGTVEELPRMADQGKFKSPVLVIIGEVVQLHDLHRVGIPHFNSSHERVLNWQP